MVCLPPDPRGSCNLGSVLTSPHSSLEHTPVPKAKQSCFSWIMPWSLVRTFPPTLLLVILPLLWDDWVSSVHENKPLFILGDFNEEPSFAQRWSTIRGFGSVSTVNDSMGQPLPTRWSGHRCIDWIWASHILMVEKLHFRDEVFSDHKPVCFSLQFSQNKVWGYKAVQTRKLLRRLMCQRDVWKQALANSWSQASLPPETSTNQEWRELLQHGWTGAGRRTPGLWWPHP